MVTKDWQEICKYAIMSKERAALLKVLEAHNPDDAQILPSNYDWFYIQLNYKAVGITVVFDPIKIAVNSQAGSIKFGFDDCIACIRHLDNELKASMAGTQYF